MSVDTAATNQHFAALLDQGYGYRARIGFLRPGIVDETLARQFYRMAPDGVTIVQAGLGLRDLTGDEVTDALERCDDAARAVAQRKPDCILLGGSPTVIMDGHGADVRWAERIREVTGIPASAAQTAAIEGLRALGATRLAIASPFPDEMNEKLTEFLERSGFVVRSMNKLTGPYRELTQTPLRAGYELARKSYDEAGDADAIYFPGAPFPVVDLIDPLERELGTSVVSSMQATLWKGLQMATGASVPVPGFGRLLNGRL